MAFKYTILKIHSRTENGLFMGTLLLSNMCIWFVLPFDEILLLYVTCVSDVWILSSLQAIKKASKGTIADDNKYAQISDSFLDGNYY